jgi:hypothetical protein
MGIRSPALHICYYIYNSLFYYCIFSGGSLYIVPSYTCILSRLRSSWKQVLFLTWYQSQKLGLVLDGPLSQSNLKAPVIWKGWGGLLCYSPTFPLLCVIRTLRPCAYSANSMVGGNYYAQWNKMCGRGGGLNRRPRLLYHARVGLRLLS